MTQLIDKRNWPRDVLLDPSWHFWYCVNDHLTNIGVKRHAEIYIEIVSWIFSQNYDMEQVHFMKMNDCIYVRFKDARDYTMFVLRFGPSNVK